MNKLLVYIITICLGVLLGIVAVNVAGPAFSSTESNDGQMALFLNAESVPVDRGVQYYFETTHLNHLQVAALPGEKWTSWPDGSLINFDAQEHAVWLHFQACNLTDNENQWLLEFYWPFLNSIDLFVYDPGSGTWAEPMSDGLSIPPEQRPFDFRLYTFPVKLPRNSTLHVYARCYSNSKLIIPLQFFQRRSYERHDDFFNLFFGFYFGVLIAMFCYNLSLSFFTEDNSYLFYSAYVLSIIIYGLMSTGFGPFYFWGNATWLKTNCYMVLSVPAFLTAALFVRRFLSLKQYGGWVYHCNNGMIAYWCLTTLLYILKPDLVWLKLLDLMAIISGFTGLATGIYLWRKGNVSARFFTIAWFFPIIGTVILMLGLVGVIEFNLPVMLSQMIGLVLELLLLSFALAERINREKARREAAQQTELDLSRKIERERKEKLEAQTRMLEVQQRSNEDLEDKVKERTQKLEQAKHRLEQTHLDQSALSIIDPLTKVHNRHYFNGFLEAEIQRACRIGHPLSILMVDIDHFKSVNDTYGHIAGDQCLRLVAGTIRDNVYRASDLVARYGGEEFVLVLPDTTPSAAVTVAERIRKAVEALQYNHQDEVVKLSISIGVAGWLPLNDASPQQLIKIADEALYDAKLNGRNRVEAAVMAGEVIEKTNDKGIGLAHA